VHARLILYKRIANAAGADELDDLQAEVIDRFGPLPGAARQLFQVTALKLRMHALGIRRSTSAPRAGGSSSPPTPPSTRSP
jgi:transcription-repair coupling factor (superfamily II helicase)